MSHRDTHSAIPQTLFDIAGIQARIHTLPGRPPFMVAPDVADVYRKQSKHLAEAVKRHKARFPEDFAFYLTEVEEQAMWSQIATTSARKRDDTRMLCFTHAGAYALSGVLTSDVAIAVGIAIHRAFAAMEAQALADAREMVGRLQIATLRKKPIYIYVEVSMQRGFSLDQMWRASNYPRRKLEQAARELRAMRIIDRLPDGMELQPDLFGED